MSTLEWPCDDKKHNRCKRFWKLIWRKIESVPKIRLHKSWMICGDLKRWLDIFDKNGFIESLGILGYHIGCIVTVLSRSWSCSPGLSVTDNPVRRMPKECLFLSFWLEKVDGSCQEIIGVHMETYSEGPPGIAFVRWASQCASQSMLPLINQ